ncbi:TPA: RepB family plasmid replication initiator protein, partial [Salmonella enterica]|nr:RepB family plasmid replication initiator protein [Enterococcus faecium]HDI5683073.1 RepB family plasmid replication initiator protein [Salmonella enterica]
MANEIVKYENRLNHIPLRKFNSREMNLFFSIASRVREKGVDEIIFSFHDLK